MIEKDTLQTMQVYSAFPCDCIESIEFLDDFHLLIVSDKGFTCLDLTSMTGKYNYNEEKEI